MPLPKVSMNGERKASGSNLIGRPSKSVDDRINLDQGISLHEYKPSYLIERKRKLIQKVKKSHQRYEEEMYDRSTYEHMLERLKTQQ